MSRPDPKSFLVFSGEMPEKRYQRGKWMSSQGKKQDLTPNELHDTTFK